MNGWNNFKNKNAGEQKKEVITMVERDDIRDALTGLYDLSEAYSITDIEGDQVDFNETQALYREKIINLIDLFGFRSIYLNKKR